MSAGDPSDGSELIRMDKREESFVMAAVGGRWQGYCRDADCGPLLRRNEKAATSMNSLSVGDIFERIRAQYVEEV